MARRGQHYRTMRSTSCDGARCRHVWFMLHEHPRMMLPHSGRYRTARLCANGGAVSGQSAKYAMTSLVGTMKHVSTPSRKIAIRHTMSRKIAI
eukprot:1961140-Prymnesium_polylepis.1